MMNINPSTIFEKINCLSSLISQLLSDKSIFDHTKCPQKYIRKVIKKIVLGNLSLFDNDFSFLIKLNNNLNIFVEWIKISKELNVEVSTNCNQSTKIDIFINSYINSSKLDNDRFEQFSPLLNNIIISSRNKNEIIKIDSLFEDESTIPRITLGSIYKPSQSQFCQPSNICSIMTKIFFDVNVPA